MKFSRRARSIFALSAISFSSVVIPVAANAVEPLFILQDCAFTPNKACIDSIEATNSSGITQKATLTGRTWKGDESYGPNGTYKNSTYYEYQVEGMQFESPAGNRFIPRIFFFPLGNNPCEFQGTVCAGNSEFIQVVVEASWFSGGAPELALPHRPTNKYCGSISNPTPCGRNLNFNQDLTFSLKLKLPTDFEISYITGRSKDLSFSRAEPSSAGSNGLSILDLKFTTLMVQRMLYTPLLTNPSQTSDYADFESDQTLVNIYSRKSAQGIELGACSAIPSISVFSNSANASLPQWNPATQSISINLENSHFKADGSLNTGFFQVAISSAIGKCLWGVDLSAQTKVEISITEKDGSDVQGVEVIAGKFSNGMFYLNHSNFHYSSPHISLKLSTDKKSELTPSVSPSPIPSVAPSAAAMQKSPMRSITCQKGKLKKKITSLSPKCPTGYKKVS
ncbi:hypothetical protein MCEMRE182_01134 [Candidatus Nanopelagicaceae bacterium]